MSNELIKALSRKLGVPEEDAQAALSMLSMLSADGSEEERTLQTIATAGEALSKTPQNVQQVLTPIIASTLMKQVSRDPFQERILSLAGGLMTLKTLLGEDNKTKELINQLTDKLNQLSQRFDQLATELQNVKQGTAQEIPNYVLEAIEDVSNKIEELRSRLDEVSKAQARRVEAPPPEAVATAGPADFVDRIKNDLINFKKMIDGMGEVLESVGYKVVKPVEPEKIPAQVLTPYEFKKRVKKILKKHKERLMKEFEEKLRHDREIEAAKARQTEMIVGGAVKIFEILINALASNVPPQELEQLKKLLVGGQGGEQVVGEGSGDVQETQ